MCSIRKTIRDGTGRDGMGSDGKRMGSDEIGWNGIEWDWMAWATGEEPEGRPNTRHQRPGGKDGRQSYSSSIIVIEQCAVRNSSNVKLVFISTLTSCISSTTLGSKPGNLWKVNENNYLLKSRILVYV